MNLFLQRNLRGYTVAKLYAKIGEYTTAVNYLSMYLQANDNCPAVHKFLAECHEKLKRPDKALIAYQRSLELDKKQPDVLVEICRLLQSDELFNKFSSKARYYFEMAESQNVQDNVISDLKIKYSTTINDNGNTQNMQELILNEVKSRPFDVGLRIRLLRHFLNQNKFEDAFKYAYDIEMKQVGQFRNSMEWYAIVSDVLFKYQSVQANDTKLNQNWPFWLLSVITLERQTYLSLAQSQNDSNLASANLTESNKYLYEFDQLLNKVANLNACPDQENELGAQFLYHFRGQLCLHAASLLFKREIAAAPRNQWRETTRNALPLLLLAYNCGIVDNTQPAWRNCSENSKQLINLWSLQSAFRCCQAGRTLRSCVNETNNNTAFANFQRICNDKYPIWPSSEEALAEIRRSTTDSDWRKRMYQMLFANIDRASSTVSSSYFAKCQALEKPTYEWPQVHHLEDYEETSQRLESSSLPHMVYLALGFEVNNRTRDNLTTISPDIKCHVFNNINLTVSNLVNCGAETLNQLDIDSFLYASTIQAKRKIEVETANLNNSENGSARFAGLSILPFANMAHRLCTDEQSDWWTAAYKVCYINAPNRLLFKEKQFIILITFFFS